MTKAFLEFNMYAFCPICGKELELDEYDDESWLANLIFTNQWDKVKGFKICCEYCNHEFELDGVEY